MSVRAVWPHDQGTRGPGHARHHPTLAQFMPRQPPTTKTVACGDDFGDIVVQLISQPRPLISGLSIRTNSASSSSRGSWSLGGGCRCLGSHITPPCMVQPGYPRLPPQLPPPLPPSCILPWNARHNQDKAMYWKVCRTSSKTTWEPHWLDFGYKHPDSSHTFKYLLSDPLVTDLSLVS